MFSEIRDRKYLRHEFNFVSKQIYRYAHASRIHTNMKDWKIYSKTLKFVIAGLQLQVNFISLEFFIFQQCPYFPLIIRKNCKVKIISKVKRNKTYYGFC